MSIIILFSINEREITADLKAQESKDIYTTLALGEETRDPNSAHNNNNNN